MDVLLITDKKSTLWVQGANCGWTHCKDGNNECTFSCGEVPSWYENETQNQNRFERRKKSHILMEVLLEKGVYVIDCEPRKLIVDWKRIDFDRMY